MLMSILIGGKAARLQRSPLVRVKRTVSSQGVGGHSCTPLGTGKIDIWSVK